MFLHVDAASFWITVSELMFPFILKKYKLTFDS